ncbi:MULTISPECIES: BREX-1 system adenine-specific DNA-methyltransferase PglX [unclassified Fibrobacter]|uniref:BREX-1 system adenine-specific DNA-methyltransferase PglX n=1 Tax=unclassified Fibrobacter TaxID=2634177 RepID=UPI00091B706E|nr:MULTISPECIES: BREX-1 system adenine-specific DNA-methyltransferase PglX [unclassified Fibrobacter]OWV06994.1 SAM-dependent methyltransferase [Fibrobacter sp. UWH3]SHK24664.1 Eco57I restriction-modification methylase [Fibrobacter sp. UWH6]
MDKNAIKNYAVWARRELISRVSQKALQYGIDADSDSAANVPTVNGKVLSESEKLQRAALIAKIRKEGYEQVMEEVAYTWFNRFCALRFMEVNDYLPSHVRVFSDDKGDFKPQIMAEAINLEIDGLDQSKVYAFKNEDNDGELFKYLVITQCNALNKVLPGMFQRIADYTELLFPDYLLEPNSAVGRLVTDIPEEDWKDAVQIIGWLYQYYNTEPKDQVFKDLEKNIKITKEKIPAATQLFTPDWIVRYMVENSLGRLWLEGHPQHAEVLKPKWKYYLDEAEQEDSVKEQLAAIRAEYAKLKPQDLRCIDPCEGSGHIVVYMFEVLVQIYQAYGYDPKDAASLIVKNNLFGLDIDDRAAQLAYFAVMMKARQYDSRFFSRGVQPRVYSIMESNDLDRSMLDYFVGTNESLKRSISSLVNDLKDAKEYGSILNVHQVDFDAIYSRIEEIRNESSIYQLPVIALLLPFVQVAEVMAQKYDVVVTNPPYMGANGMAAVLSEYIKSLYPDSKADLFAVFIEKGFDLLKSNGLLAMITMQSWMFLSSYERLRTKLVEAHTIKSLLHLGIKAFDEIGNDIVQTASFVLEKQSMVNYVGQYFRLLTHNREEKVAQFLSRTNLFLQKQSRYEEIPGTPIAFWVGEGTLTAFSSFPQMISVAEPKQGIATADNNRFLRLWFEVGNHRIGFGCKNTQNAVGSGCRWFPYQKGGDFRKWYGNNNFVIDWDNDGYALKHFTDKSGKLRSALRNLDYSFRTGLTWTWISTGNFGARLSDQGCLFDVAGSTMFAENNLNWLLGCLCSKVADYLLRIINPTINFSNGVVAKMPVKFAEEDNVNSFVEENVLLSRSDWDSFETSWDFHKHPLVPSRDELAENAMSQFAEDRLTKLGSILWNYERWERKCESRFNTLKSNEEELNRIFIDIYGLRDELTPDVEDRDVTIRKADLERDIKSLISYAVGCMFGRYSLDREGLIYAGGEWNLAEYKSFEADPDNIIPICDDEYFSDDIVGRFVEFIKVAYGADQLEDNLKFIADALGGKGTPRDIIRSYFLNDFFKDHCNTYQVTGSGKRPIYWLFDSGKKNGFKCLIYMHRYQSDTIARIRTDYVHEQQSRYDTAIDGINSRLNEVISSSEQVRLKKQLAKLMAQKEEVHTYEEKIHHLADQMISIDLDDGVKVNYEKFKDVLAKIK